MLEFWLIILSINSDWNIKVNKAAPKVPVNNEIIGFIFLIIIKTTIRGTINNIGDM